MQPVSGFADAVPVAGVFDIIGRDPVRSDAGDINHEGRQTSLPCLHIINARHAPLFKDGRF